MAFNNLNLKFFYLFNNNNKLPNETYKSFKEDYYVIFLKLFTLVLIVLIFKFTNSNRINHFLRKFIPLIYYSFDKEKFLQAAIFNDLLE